MPKRQNKKVKILLVQISNRNLGDTVIADNVVFLLNKAFPFFKKNKYDILSYNVYTDDVEQVKYADAVVFDGGGIIKYKMEHFYQKIIDITAVAQQYNVPVFFNAVGVEGYNGEDERCVQMKNALNQSCVKAITIRDDLQTLNQDYITNKAIKTKSVFDSAVWSSFVYKDIKHNKKSNIIGLGVARDKLFTDHEIENIDHDYLLEFWKQTALEIEKRGLCWKIFTNGTGADERFAKEILDYIGHGEKVNPLCESRQLVQTICSFKGIIACRMHTNIVAYSYKIPSVGLVWNDKLSFWGEKIGYPERFVTSDKLNAKYVVDTLFTAIDEGCVGLTKAQRYTPFNELKAFVTQYCRANNQHCENIGFSKHLLAPALGTKEIKFKNMNSLVTFEQSVNHGFVNIETDVRLSKDNKLVLVNGWNKQTYDMLGLDSQNYDEFGLDYDYFMASKYYSNYDTANFDSLLAEYKRISEKNNLTIILDIGKPAKDRTKLMLEKIKSAMASCGVNKNDFVIRLQRKNDVALAKEIDLGLEIMYYLPDDTKDDKSHLQQVISYCKKNKISRISMKSSTFTDETAKSLRDSKMKPCVFSFTKSNDIISAINKGAEFVGSFIYDVDYFNRLTK